MNKHVTVAEIGPRDGFQSISCMMIPTETKLEIIEATPLRFGRPSRL